MGHLLRQQTAVSIMAGSMVSSGFEKLGQDIFYSGKGVLVLAMITVGFVRPLV